MTRHVAGHAFSTSLPAEQCTACGLKVFEGRDLARFELAVAAALADAGVVEPDALKFIRKASGIQGNDFAALLGVRPETVSRWEQGKTPIDRATFTVLRQLLLEQMRGASPTAEFLRSLEKPKKLRKRVRLDLAA